jgi:uncharacterized membrane protein YraQ (UPF0718 family)
MQRRLTILRLLLWLTMVVVGFALSRQLDALSRTLKHNHLQQEQVLKEHQQFVDEHERRMDALQQVLDEHARRMERC